MYVGLDAAAAHLTNQLQRAAQLLVRPALQHQKGAREGGGVWDVNAP